ncbi:MAG: mannitol-1-phosphate 5-dehydrogenase [Anaerolineae bacterium]
MKARRAVIFGAGNVGRGFLGHLLHRSGYRLTFVDVDRQLVAAIKEIGGYRLRLAYPDHDEQVVIAPVDALLAEDATHVCQVLTEAEVAVTAVGARALPAIAPLIAEGLRLRRSTRLDAPLNVIICENLRDAATVLRREVESHLPRDLHPYMAEHLGLVMSVIGRMVTQPRSEELAQDGTLVVAEPYWRLPVDRAGFKGPIPPIEGLEPYTPFSPWVDRKLFLHNAGHAVLAYLGHLRGHEVGWQAVTDASVRPCVRRAMEESSRALAAEHGFALDELQRDADELMVRFANPRLNDPITRLARDPMRKLASDDRLVGAARLCLRHGVEPDALAWGIAAALCYDDPTDASAQELQQRLRERGLEETLADVCGLAETEPLASMVTERYRALLRGDWPVMAEEASR